MDNIINIEDKKNKPRAATAGSGGGGHSSDLEKRVERLETKFDKMNETLIRIEAKLDSKASAVDVAEIKGQLKYMPTTWQLVVTYMAGMLGVAGFVFAIVKYVK